MTSRKYKSVLPLTARHSPTLSSTLLLLSTWHVIFAQAGYSQLIDRFDCSENPNFEQINQENLTHEELITLMDRELIRELSEEDRCDRPTDSNSGGSGGGGGSSGSGGGGNGSSNLAAEGVSQNPPNQLSSGQQSQMLTDSLNSVAELQSNYASGNSSQDGSNGAPQNQLIKSDANAELITRLEARLQETSDPNIRTQLEENIQKLKSQK